MKNYHRAVALTFAALLLLIKECYGNLPPIFSMDMHNLALSENTPVGNVVYTLEGTDPENSRVYFGLHGTDLFRVNRTTGEVTVEKPLDRETNDTLNFFVTIEDEVKDAPLGGNNVVEVPVTVIVYDENDNAPLFLNVPYEFEVDEDATMGSTVYSGIALEDPDSVGLTIEVDCVNLPGYENACETFQLKKSVENTENRYEGELVLAAKLNYTIQETFEMLLKASDGQLTNSTKVVVHVRDVQDTPPQFFGDMSAEVFENVSINTLVMTVHAEDGDQQKPRPIVYELVTNPMNYFLLDAATGELRTAKPLDREDNPSGTLLLGVKARELVNGQKVSDPLTETTAQVTIRVKDVNDEPPTFNRRDYYVEIPENIQEGSPLPNLNMTVHDPDIGSNSEFALSLNDISNAFTIEPETARGSTPVTIRVNNSSLDYENLNQRKFLILVVAKELYTEEQLSSTATVTITVTDANDNAPTFDQDHYSASISEVSAPGTLVTTVVAKDRDSGKFGENGIVYSLLGNGADKFVVNNRTGAVIVAHCDGNPGSESCLDYETKSDYLLTFRATDDDGKGQTSMVPLKISLSDNNDNAPKFSQSVYKVYVDEGATRFDPELVISAVDNDKTSHITYSIIAGNDEKLFYMDPNTGKIKITKNTGLDLSDDSFSNIRLTVEADDGKYTASTIVEINVKDINNNAPKFSQDHYMYAIKEDVIVGTQIGTIKATDADTGLNSEIMYRLQKSDDFHIDAESGALSVASKLDSDRRNTYNLDVVAVDKGEPSLSSMAMLTISVINTNDKMPYFVPTMQKAEVLEDAPVGTLVHTLIAMDPDVNNSEALNFAATEPITAMDKHGHQVLASDDYRDFFSVDRNTGKVTVAKPLLRDIAATVRITVLVTDITAPSIQQGEGLLTITITDVNDSPPSFAPPWTIEEPFYKLELKEEQPVGTIVATYNAYDQDSEIAAYAINPASEYFEINNGTGIVQIKKQIDYEQVSRLNFTIVAYDSGFPQLNATASVAVDVVNVNDNDPVFSQSSYEGKIEENAPKGSFVMQVEAADKDAGNFGQITYELVGQHSEHFVIDGQSGEISVRDSEFLDRESIAETTVQVVASDGAPTTLKRSASVPVHIRILDLNDNAPHFNQSVYNLSVVENVRLNPPVPLLTINATDADVNSVVRYRIIQGNQKGVFLLGEDTGILYAHKSLIDGPRSYKLIIEARDGEGSGALTDRAQLNVQVLNVNEHKPAFIMPALINATVEITEDDAVQDFLVMTVKATDKDYGENGRVSYHLNVGGSIVQETDEFIINSTTGELKTKKLLDRETKGQYELILVARDHGLPKWYESQCYLTILLVDMDDNRPEFPDSKSTNPYTFYISENDARGIRIGQVKALDRDEGKHGRVYYYLLSESESFTLDKSDGSLYTNKSFDREQRAEYDLLILANNEPDFYLSEGHPLRSSNGNAEQMAHDGSVAKVRVIVRDLNDNAPRFERDIYYAAVNAMANVNKFILNATAVDPDYGINGTITYYIKASNLYKYGSDKSSGSIIPSPFNISQHGQLTTATYLAENNQHRFVVDVVAREDAFPERETLAKVHVWIFEPNQLNRIILSRPVDEVIREKDEIIAELSNATQSRVIVDDIRYHTDDLGRKNEDWSDMYILVIDPATKSIIPVPEVLKTIDSKYDFLKDYYAGFAIENVVPAFASEPDDSFDPALAALIALLIVLIVGIITFIVVCCCLRHWAIAPNIKKKDALIKKAIIDDLNTTENPLWIEQKLKIYEEQELTMQVFNEPETNGINRRASEEFLPDDNTYATIQHPNRRGSVHMATLSMGDEFPDYATLSGMAHHSNSSTLRGSPNYYEAAMGFQGSTFQVPDPLGSSSEDFNTFNRNRFKNSANLSNNTANKQHEYVAELI